MAVVMLIATTGFSMNKHYCMGSLKSVKVYFSDQHDHSDDACGDMGRMMECCDDEHSQWKIQDLTKNQDDVHFETADFGFVAPPITPPEYLHLGIPQEVFFIPDYEVPDPPEEDLLIQNQVFRV